MPELNATRLLASLRHLIECATQGKAPTPLFLVGHAELVLSAVEKITSLERQRDKSASKNQQDKIRLVQQQIELMAMPGRLAQVVSNGNFIWGEVKCRLSPLQECLIRCLLTKDGRIRVWVPTDEVIKAVYPDSTLPRSKLVSLLLKATDKLKTKLHKKGVKAGLMWSGKGHLRLLDLRRGDDYPPVGGVLTP
jgi:hypothetical protein